MIALIVLVVSFALFRLSGLAIPYMADWQFALRAALGVMFLFTASAHWGKRRPDLLRMVPGALGSADFWVTLSGIAEIFFAIGLQIPNLAIPAGALAGVMLVCLFAGNAKAAREKLTIGGRPVPSLWPRLAIQVIFLAAIAAAMWPRPIQ
ncbi:MAG: hypothetical protein WCC26_18780 [Terracidiphilus sp.]